MPASTPTSVKAGDDGVPITVGPDGKERAEIRAEILLVAAGRATNVEDVGLETTAAEVDRGFVKVDGHMRTREPHLYAIGDIVGGLMLAHTAAHEGITAVHTIAGDPDVHAMDYAQQPRATYCRPEIASIGLTEQECEAKGLPIKTGQGPVPGDRQGAHRRRVRGLRQDHRQQGHRRHARDPHHRPARDGPHRGGLARVHARGDAVGDRASDARAPDALGDHGRGRDGDRRAVHQLVAGPPAAEAQDAMTVTGDGRNTATSPLAASAGLTDDDLRAMYRTVALARAVDERMWILNRAGRIPFVISGQGHEGAQVGLAWPLRRGHDWIAPYYRSIATCIAFGMTARDLMLAQYAKASDVSLWRAPDARPLRQRRAPHRHRSRRRSRRRSSMPLASRSRRGSRATDAVSVAIMGEGSSNQGDVHEGLNFAAIHKLPFILVIENNGYAISVPAEKELSVKDVASRAPGYGIPGVDRRRDGRARVLRRPAARPSSGRGRAAGRP